MCFTPLSLLFTRLISVVSAWYYSQCARLPCHLISVSEGRVLNIIKTVMVSNGTVFEISFVRTVVLVSVTWTFKFSCLSFHLQLPVVSVNKARVLYENFLSNFCIFIDCFCAGNVALCYMARTRYVWVCVCTDATCLIHFFISLWFALNWKLEKFSWDTFCVPEAIYRLLHNVIAKLQECVLKVILSKNTVFPSP